MVMDFDVEKFFSILKAGHLVLALVGCLLVFWVVMKFRSSPPPERQNVRRGK
jgi:hypothetical protein